MQNNNPLVSVPVITYNSSKYVLETLESIKAQTYQNIELVVSDDCSTDNTVEICRKWIDENKERFVRTELITSEKNTGVSANGNRGRKACRGEWIKSIAGDDLLKPNCVEECIKYVIKNPKTIYLFSRVEVFGENKESVDYITERGFDYSFFTLSNEEQRKRYLIKGIIPIPAPTAFYNKLKTIELGITNDERIPMLEDAPKWATCIEKGIHFHFIDEELVKYRVSETALSTRPKLSEKSKQSQALYYLYYRFPKNVPYVGRRKAYQDYVLNKAIVSKSIVWKIGAWCILKIYKMLNKKK